MAAWEIPVSMRFKLLLPVVALLTCLSGAKASAVLVDRILAMVNSETVLLSDVDRFYKTQELRREIDPLMGLVDGIDAPHPPRALVLEYLVQEKLIGQLFKVQDAEVDAKVSEVMRSNNLNRDALNQFLASKGFEYQDYTDLIRVSLQKQALLDREIRSRVNISDDDVRNNYFHSKASAQGAPVEYALRLITIRTSSYKAAKHAMDAARNALKAIREGEAFPDVARRVSDDDSAQSGGDIGFISSEYLNAPLLAAVKSLKIGGVSGVVQNGDVLYIVQLKDMRSLRDERFNASKEQIREVLARAEYRRQITLWYERAKSSAFVKINAP